MAHCIDGKWGRRMATVGILLTAMFATACGSAANGSAEKHSQPVSSSVTLGIGGALTDLNPVDDKSYQDGVAAEALYSPLVTLNQSGKVIPDLATSWTVTSTAATFHIRSDVTCSDGTKVTPQVVANSLNYFFAPSTHAVVVKNVIGPGNTATATPNNGADTVTVTVAHPWSQLLVGLAGASHSPVICPAGLSDPASLATHSDGTGPFVSSSEVPGASYTFKRRAGYTWGPVFPGEPKSGSIPETLTLKVVSDENTAANLQKTGSLGIEAYTTSDWKTVAKQSGYSKATELQSDVMMIFNEAPGHVTDQLSVRKAIAEAVNRQTIGRIIGGGTAYLENSIGKKTYACYDASLGKLIPSYNEKAAASVLKGLKLRIIGTTILVGGDATSYVLAAVNAAGASATLNNEDNAAWVQGLFSGAGNWDVTLLVTYSPGYTVISPYGGYLTGAASPSGNNFGDIQNTEATSALAAASTATGSTSCTDVRQFESALMKNIDVVPLAASPVTVVYAKGLSGVAVNGVPQTSSIRVHG